MKILEIQKEKVTYDINIYEDEIEIYEGQTLKLSTNIITMPSGHEKLFENEKINWSSSNKNILHIDEEGYITGIREGTAIVTARLLKKEDMIVVNVKNSSFIMQIVILLIIVLVELAIWIFIQ